MRAMVATQLRAQTPEEFFNIVLVCVSMQRAGVWQDLWHPENMLRQTGFGVLTNASIVLAIANADDNLADLVVRYRRDTNEEHCSLIADGFAKLSHLKQQLCGKFECCGDTHWASPMDVVFLGEACNVGSIIFT